jgi:hypothetical protein
LLTPPLPSATEHEQRPDRVGYDDLSEAAREAVDRHRKHIGKILASRGIVDLEAAESET